MSEKTTIAWTDSTISFWWGCHKVAPGCKDCYAKGIAERFAGDYWGLTKPRLWIKSACASLEALNRKAEREGKVRLVFINSMSDFFEDFDGPIVDRKGKRLYDFENGYSLHSPEVNISLPPTTLASLRREAFPVMGDCPWLRCLLLTKRPENIPAMWPSADVFDSQSEHKAYWPNFWLMTSISDQETADRNLPLLANCRDLAPVLGVSLEPMQGPVDFTNIKRNDGWTIDALRGMYSRSYAAGLDEPGCEEGHGGGPKLDWIIIGVESDGPRVGRLGAFADEAAWREGAADVVRQCRDAGTACFVKQVPINGRVSHDPEEWPEPLRVRQFPQPERTAT